MTRFNLTFLNPLYTKARPECGAATRCKAQAGGGLAWQRHNASAVRPVTDGAPHADLCLFSCSHRSLPALGRARQAVLQVKRELHSPGDCVRLSPAVWPDATRAGLDAAFMGQTGGALNLGDLMSRKRLVPVSKGSSELYPWIDLQ